MLNHEVTKFQSVKSGQILCAHKPYLLMLGHNYSIVYVYANGIAAAIVYLSKLLLRNCLYADNL